MNILKDIVVKLAVGLIKYLIREGNNNLFEVKGSLVRKQDIFLTNIAFLVLFAKFGIKKDLILKVIANNNCKPPANYKLTGGELWRSQIMQDYYYNTGASKTKNSKHQERTALDINVFIDDIYRTDKEAYKHLAEYWKTLDPNNVSGFDWNWDINHFQMS